jgi:endonuclease III
MELLKIEFPNPRTALNHHTGFELLIASVLSAQCTDERVNETTPVLFQKYPTIEDFAQANQSELVEDIKSISLRNNKAKNIIRLSQILIEEFDGEVPNTLDELMSLPGVGRKIANSVLGEWFRIPSGFLVDTHIKRCAYRMGLTDSHDPKVIEQDLMAAFPQTEWIDMASRILFHGRTTCPASRKSGENCSLGSLCNVR